MARVVIIGGDAAGMSAAAQASRGRVAPEMVVFERGPHTSYAACGLPYYVGGLVERAEALVARSPEQHRARGIDVRIRHEVTGIDLDRRVVEVHDLDGGVTSVEPFDDLLIATGARPVRPPLPNLDADGVFGVHTIPEAVELDALLRDRDVRRAVVVGAGYIGLEMVEAFLLRGIEVTVVELADQPMLTLDADMAARVADGVRGLGVDLRLGVGVEGVEIDDAGRVRAVSTSAGEIETEAVVLGLGVRPNNALAIAAGIPIGPSGGIATDDRMSTRVDGVWAAGDCAESHHRVSGQPAAIALGTHANKQGRVVGINLSGGDARFPGYIGTAVTKVAHVEIGRTGLSEREAALAGFDAVGAVIEGTSRAHYYPGGEKMAVKIIAERSTGRMLGAQIVGGEGAAKRVDALAIAVWNEMTVDEFSQTDLGYAPPFSPVWDPTLIAARQVGGSLG